MTVVGLAVLGAISLGLLAYLLYVIARPGRF